MEERLKKFVQLVEAGSFTRASRQLHLSQPALSVAIAKLERELRAPLLVHGARPLALTPAGQLAYRAGKELQVRADNLQTQLAELTQQKLRVALGMIDSVAGALFAAPASVTKLERRAAVSLVVDNSRNLLGAVEKAELDLAFVVERRPLSGQLVIVDRAVEPLALVCHATQRAAANQALGVGVLPRFISYDQASITQQLVTEALAAEGLTLRPGFHSTSPEVMLRLVLLEKGVAALPYLLVRDYLDSGELCLVGRSATLISRPIVAIKRRDRLLAAPLERTVRDVVGLLAVIDAEARQLPAESRGA